jgi:hypothetical protein
MVFALVRATEVSGPAPGASRRFAPRCPSLTPSLPSSHRPPLHPLDPRLPPPASPLHLASQVGGLGDPNGGPLPAAVTTNAAAWVQVMRVAGVNTCLAEAVGSGPGSSAGSGSAPGPGASPTPDPAAGSGSGPAAGSGGAAGVGSGSGSGSGSGDAGGTGAAATSTPTPALRASGAAAATVATAAVAAAVGALFLMRGT